MTKASLLELSSKDFHIVCACIVEFKTIKSSKAYKEFDQKIFVANHG